VEDLKGKVAWVTGAGSGIGEAGALALAGAGMTVVLTGRRQEPLDNVAGRITKGGGKAQVRPADVTDERTVGGIADFIRSELGGLYVLVNNAGLNVPKRAWKDVGPQGIRTVIDANLTGAFLVAQAALPIMRAQKSGIMIHTASWAGRFIGPVSGPAYVAAKHGLVAMSHTINLEEGGNGIRSTALCPGEVATPILANRPVPETPETMARMLQPDDLGELILFIAHQHPRVCLNEVVISPTHNRGYLRTMQAHAPPASSGQP
jgi:NAD(P)-dependent dehydrogenase (short-subunit alcohol dehydrogenase family)